MTNENLFQEAQDDLERQKLENLWKSYGGLLLALALTIVVATAGYNFWDAQNAKQNQKATGDLVALLNQANTDQAKQVDALEQFAKANDGKAQAAFAALHAGAMAAKDGKTDKAVQIYDALAADAKADTAFRQLADLLTVEMQADTGDAAKLLQRLQPLMAENAPWRFSAMEQGGYLALRSGDKAKAKGWFTELSQDASVPRSMSNRAADVLRLLGE